MEKVIPFLNTRKITLFLSSIILVVLCAGIIARGGFNVGIDFKPGLSMNVIVPRADNPEDIIELLNSIENLSVQQGENSHYLIRIADSGEPTFRDETEQKIETLLGEKYGTIEVETSEFIGASYSSSLIVGTILVVIIALIATTLYLLIRFKKEFALAALISTIHDVLFMIVFIGIMKFEVSIVSIAAILTIMGYSLNDTIVIFDRIRENLKNNKSGSSYAEIINQSITSTLDRTVTTSISTLLAVVSLAIFLKGSVQLFAVEVIFGVIIGSYSSIFIASVVLNLLHEKFTKKQKKSK